MEIPKCSMLQESPPDQEWTLLLCGAFPMASVSHKLKGKPKNSTPRSQHQAMGWGSSLIPDISSPSHHLQGGRRPFPTLMTLKAPPLDTVLPPLPSMSSTPVLNPAPGMEAQTQKMKNLGQYSHGWMPRVGLLAPSFGTETSDLVSLQPTRTPPKMGSPPLEHQRRDGKPNSRLPALRAVSFPEISLP